VDPIDEYRDAFAAATSTRYWRTFDWYVDKILDQALAAGLDASDHKAADDEARIHHVSSLRA